MCTNSQVLMLLVMVGKDQTLSSQACGDSAIRDEALGSGWEIQ